MRERLHTRVRVRVRARVRKLVPGCGMPSAGFAGVRRAYAYACTEHRAWGRCLHPARVRARLHACVHPGAEPPARRHARTHACRQARGGTDRSHMAKTGSNKRQACMHFAVRAWDMGHTVVPCACSEPILTRCMPATWSAAAWAADDTPQASASEGAGRPSSSGQLPAYLRVGRPAGTR